MGSKMLIDATHPEETRVVVVRGNRIDEFDFESAARKQLKGNIYLAKVTRVEPSLQAAFVDYGGNRHGFLAFTEIHPDYYQIPIADRQALLRQEEDEARRSEEEFEASDGLGNGSAPASIPADEPIELPSDRSSTAANEVPGAAEVDPSPMVIADNAPQGELSPRDTGGENGSDAPPTIEVIGEEPPARLSSVETVDEDPEARAVESVGAEDALEELPQRPRKQQRRHYKIQEVIKRRQVILVQVVKEERGNKGAALTTYLSLAGRYCVLMPNTARGGGISRKITDAGDRRRLKEVAREVEVPDGMGLIVRTAGAQRTRQEIKRDYDYLMRLWESVRDLTLSSTAPCLVYEEGDLIRRSIRDLYSKDVDEVLVDGENAYRDAKDFMKMLMPSHARNVKLYKDTRPLFSRYQIETQLDSLFSQSVTLPSGGYMVINQTEALVSIDVNSGKATREHNIEDTALRTNQEAAEEIARQLRLRDLAGLIVIDFIDMEEKRNNRSVERRLKEALKNDRARIQVGRISHFGLLEMSRQRLRQGMLEGSTKVCPSCEGRGLVRSVSSCALSVLRNIEEQFASRKAENLTATCHRDVASYILNEKRDHVLSLEQNFGVSIFIVPSDSVKAAECAIEFGAERAVPIRRAPVAIQAVKMESALGEADDAGARNADATDEEAAPPAPAGRTTGEEETFEPRRNRRRGRRGRHGRRRAGNGQTEPSSTERQREDPAGTGSQPYIEADPGTNREMRVTSDADLELTAPSPPSHPAVQSEGRPRRMLDDAFGDGNETNGQRAAQSVDAAEEAGDGAPTSVQSPLRPEGSTAAPAAAAEEESAALRPRRWQPPAATIERSSVPRRAGWWQKRS
jgi:ribonuclease E